MSNTQEKFNCTFTSVWSDGSVIATACMLDEDTGEVTPDVVDVGDRGSLVREYITHIDEEIEVCSDCHSFVMKVVIAELADLSYGEVKVCSNPDCESNQ
jgi:hypothetical protein